MSISLAEQEKKGGRREGKSKWPVMWLTNTCGGLDSFSILQPINMPEGVIIKKKKERINRDPQKETVVAHHVVKIYLSKSIVFINTGIAA